MLAFHRDASSQTFLKYRILNVVIKKREQFQDISKYSSIQEMGRFYVADVAILTSFMCN